MIEMALPNNRFANESPTQHSLSLYPSTAARQMSSTAATKSFLAMSQMA